MLTSDFRVAISRHSVRILSTLNNMCKFRSDTYCKPMKRYDPCVKTNQKRHRQLNKTRSKIKPEALTFGIRNFKLTYQLQ